MQWEHEVVFEQASDGGWSAHVPGLPTILVGADTREEAEALVQAAIVLSLQDRKILGEKGQTV